MRPSWQMHNKKPERMNETKGIENELEPCGNKGLLIGGPCAVLFRLEWRTVYEIGRDTPTTANGHKALSIEALCHQISGRTYASKLSGRKERPCDVNIRVEPNWTIVVHKAFLIEASWPLFPGWARRTQPTWSQSLPNRDLENFPRGWSNLSLEFRPLGAGPKIS